MAKAQLATSPQSRGRKMPKKEKQCQFPGCTTTFMGIGAARYCEEHKTPEARKIMNEIRAKEREQSAAKDRPNNSNKIIKHNYSVATTVTEKCICGKEYEVTLFPGVEIYPKYCEEHRNPFRRDQLLKKLGVHEEIIAADHSDVDTSEIPDEELKKLEDEFGVNIFETTDDDELF
jgi:hypothetical protein